MQRFQGIKLPEAKPIKEEKGVNEGPPAEIPWFSQYKTSFKEFPSNISNKLELTFSEFQKGREIEVYIEIENTIFTINFEKLILKNLKTEETRGLKRGLIWRMKCLGNTFTSRLKDVEKGKWFYGERNRFFIYLFLISLRCFFKLFYSSIKNLGSKDFKPRSTT